MGHNHQELKELSDRNELQSPSDYNLSQISEMARLWVQVIHELRHGVKLKKVAAGALPWGGEHRPAAEYELTPYEMLMDDIRSRRYKLRQVPERTLPPRVAKDAHELILDFIRSRPPLRRASQRKLKPPPPRAPTPRELLLDSIKSSGLHRLRRRLARLHRLRPQE